MTDANPDGYMNPKDELSTGSLPLNGPHGVDYHFYFDKLFLPFYQPDSLKLFVIAYD